MTNQAILSILNNLCNEARESVHATLGLIKMHRDVRAGLKLLSSIEASRNSADLLLRSIDDARDLLADDSPAAKGAQQFDAGICVSQTVELLNLLSAERDRRVVLETPAEPVIIQQDRQALEQAVTRILDAALKMVSAGEVRAAIERGSGGVQFTLTFPNASLAVQLADSLNADPEQVQFPDPADVASAIAVMVAGKRLRSMGGTVELAPAPGGSKRLAIRLPCQSAEMDLQPQQPVENSGRLNILVTEDCDESYALSELMLRSENVYRAQNGPQAIAIVKKRRFDLVLMDVHMPGMDGYTAIRAIRDWETRTASARTPIVVLSAGDLDAQRRSAAQSGCSGFLRRPLRESDLLGLLQRVKSARGSMA